jgi:hypothetical protein
MAEGRDEDEMEKLDIEIGMAEDPADAALAALADYQKRAGMVFENPDAVVPGPEGTGEL